MQTSQAPTPLCAVLPHAHPLTSGAALCWDALRDTPLVTLNAEAGTRNVTERTLNTYRVGTQRTNECAHVATALRMIELGLGIGVLPIDTRASTLPSSLVARPLVPEVSVTTMLVRRRHRSLRPNADAVWTLLADGNSRDPRGGARQTQRGTRNPIRREAADEPMPLVPR
ncbi:LysR substrate-binding domain-containing protein [Burkholderia sp. Bp9140]|uniref:LysR substrate-binding domain-containing protein n=1 Tax=Burkholderia sp. Bp9140 TaxID=2184572 RepID=UPI0021AB8C3B|nr:LysR substrate-binding domain-containing protein [Burkholderia sp. Bp9140]